MRRIVIALAIVGSLVFPAGMSAAGFTSSFRNCLIVDVSTPKAQAVSIKTINLYCVSFGPRHRLYLLQLRRP
jgi:hypothetical protein